MPNDQKTAEQLRAIGSTMLDIVADALDDADVAAGMGAFLGLREEPTINAALEAIGQATLDAAHKHSPETAAVTEAPHDRRILVWVKDYHADFRLERGWFTAEWDVHETAWRIGLQEIEGCCWLKDSEIAGWHELPPDLQGALDNEVSEG